MAERDQVQALPQPAVHAVMTVLAIYPHPVGYEAELKRAKAVLTATLPHIVEWVAEAVAMAEDGRRVSTEDYLIGLARELARDGL